MTPLPDKQYQIIYADPPWSYRNFKSGIAKKTTTYGSAAHHYPTLSTAEIESLPVKTVAHTPAWLFLWVTMPFLPDGLAVMKAWGFTYKTCAFSWVKTRGSGYYSGLGFYTNGNVELCLLGTLGQPKRVARNVKQLLVSPLQAHSQKPAEARDRIVELCGDLPRIELFARQRTVGWDTWGNDENLVARL